MRIRKHAAKLLLGSACPPPPQQYSPPPPPPPCDDEYNLLSVGDDGLFLCQLNCSPWDVLDFNHYYFQRQHLQEEEEGDEGKGIMGNVLEYADEEGIFGISEAMTKSTVVVAAQPYLNFEDEEEDDGIDRKNNVKKKRRRRKKEKEENNDDDNDEKTSSVVTVIAKSGGGRGVGIGQLVPGICKKNDGKGWHCNRPANPNHTLCDHHLAQLKSYSSSRCSIAAVESEPNASTQGVKNHNKSDHVRSPVKHRRRKTKAVAATSVKSNGDGYYYYSGFGLSRGKQGRSNCRNEEAKVEEAVEEVSAGGGHNGSNSGDDGSDAPIAGGDLDDDTDDDDDDEPVGNIVDNNKGIIRRKKRGRKPIKARSLKSFL